MENLLSKKMYYAIEEIGIDKITEIRVRVNKPLVVKKKNELIIVKDISSNKDYIVNDDDIKNILNVASEYSLYSIEDKLANGFITYKTGVRIGIIGEAVYINNKVKTIKNISSLVIRLPHEIIGCSSSVFNNIYKFGQVYNTLIISKVGKGKTTLLRDLIRNIANFKDILVVDERNELSGTYKNNASFDLGLYSDILIYMNKNDAYERVIRSCSPDVIAVDEIYSINDFEKLVEIKNTGTSIISTMHINNNFELKHDFRYKQIVDIFEYIVELDSKNIGKINKIIKVNNV